MKPIRTLLDWLGWERLSETRARHDQLIKRLDKIMSSQLALTQEVKNLTALLAAANLKINETNDKVLKIGTETDGLLEKIAALEEAIENQDNASPELVAAFAEAKANATTLSESVDKIAGTAQAGDAKVPDAPVENPPPVEEPPAQ